MSPFRLFATAVCVWKSTLAAVAVVRDAASIVWMLVALSSLRLLLQQHPQYREDNECCEEERERTPREQSEGGRRKEEAERPGGDGQGSEDEQENQYHGAGNRPSRVRALDAGRVILARVHLASLLNPLAYDPTGPLPPWAAASRPRLVSQAERDPGSTDNRYIRNDFSLPSARLASPLSQMRASM